MGNSNNGIDEEPNEQSESSPRENSSAKRNGVYQKLRRDLSEEELNNPGAQKMILSDLDRLENEVEALKIYKDLFHKKDKESAVKDELLKTSTSKEILYAVALSLGATLIGLSPSLWVTESNKINFGVIILGLGLILMIVGLLTKFISK